MKLFYTINYMSSIGEQVIGRANGKFVPNDRKNEIEGLEIKPISYDVVMSDE